MAVLRPPTWIELQQSALKANLRAAKGLLKPETGLMAVVKANAYGHGLSEVGALLKNRPEVQWLGVARLSEGLTLRKLGIHLPTLVLGHTSEQDWNLAASESISLAIHEEGQLRYLLSHAFPNLGPRKLKIHLKVDTGMHRLGLQPREVPEIAKRTSTLADRIEVEGIFSHFHSADAEIDRLDLSQLRIFERLVSDLQRQQLCPPLCHCANTAAILRWPESHFNLVRLGGGLYGLNPDSRFCQLPPPFHPVLSWKAQVVQVRQLRAGMGLGYGQTFRALRPTLIAVLPVGYGDGLLWPNFGRREVLFEGGISPLVGRICMDQSFADVTDLGVGVVKVGDEAVLIGKTRDSSQYADVIAIQEGTIEYDVTTRLASRIPRILR